MKKITILVFILVLAIVLVIYFARFKSSRSSENNLVSTPNLEVEISETPEKVDIKASFAIFTNGTVRTFTAVMYHNLSPDVYITAENPNIVVVEKEGITWQEFFDTLPFKLTKNCLITGTKQTFCTDDSGILKFYLNGTRDGDLLDREINNTDETLITFGPEEEPNLEYQFSQIPNTE